MSSSSPEARGFAGATSATGDFVAYFGYGSLVNRATHRTAIVDAIPARLLGWRRMWRPRPDMPGFPAALLTIGPEPGSSCDGLLVVDRAENLAAVDEREARYRRVALAPSDLEVSGALPRECPLYVYVAQEELPLHKEPPSILQSYLDAVMQGFLAEHGEAGLRRFVSDTANFDMPILADRHAPRYPRAVALTEKEQALFETLLGELQRGAVDDVASRRTEMR